VQIWQPPFHKLTNTEVQYLVRGIAEVYGQDEGEWRQQQQQLMQASSMQVSWLGGWRLWDAQGFAVLCGSGASRAVQYEEHQVCCLTQYGRQACPALDTLHCPQAALLPSWVLLLCWYRVVAAAWHLPGVCPRASRMLAWVQG
jgi:hypothetical protein